MANANCVCSKIWRIHHNERERFRLTRQYTVPDKENKHFPTKKHQIDVQNLKSQQNHHLDPIISEFSLLVCLVWILILSMFDPQNHLQRFPNAIRKTPGGWTLVG